MREVVKGGQWVLLYMADGKQHLIQVVSGK
jgi:hypothetical protein